MFLEIIRFPLHSYGKKQNMLSLANIAFRGINFQNRKPHSKQFIPFEDDRYPLSLGQRIQQGDQFRRSEEELSSLLKAIEDIFSSGTRPHTAQPDCETCVAKKQRIWQAYSNYYLGNGPGRWDTDLLPYRAEMATMFNSPEQYTLEEINVRFRKELREHLRKDLCTPRPDADPQYANTLSEFSTYLSKKFEENEPIETIIQTAIDMEVDHPHPFQPEETSMFLRQLHKTNTTQDRAQVYKAYYCTPSWDDSPQQKNIKAKYERMFDSGLSPDAVISQWKQEALDTQKQEISRLKHRLGDLKMAQSAHLKNKAAKKAEQDQRMQDVVQKQIARCNLQSCGREVDLTDEEGVLECAVCDWLAAKGQTEGERREHAYYCCEEHVEEDFVWPPYIT